MDATDVRVFCAIAFKDLSYNATTQRHVSPTEIGRKLGIDEKTVRARISRMEDDGFIKYYQAMPSLALFGLASVGLYRFEAFNIATKRKVLQSIQQIPNVVEALDYIGPTISVLISGESEEGTRVTAAGIALRAELTHRGLGTKVVRDSAYKMDRLDWQLIQKLRYDARASTTEIAKVLRVTPRMAEYRTNKMLDSGALLIRAVIDPKAQSGLLFYELELSVEEGKMAGIIEALRGEHGEKLWSVSSPSPRLVLANLFAFSLGETEDAAFGAQNINGVRHCHLFILKESVEPKKGSWLDKLILQKLEKLD